jgi:uncharacterized protein
LPLSSSDNPQQPNVEQPVLPLKPDPAPSDHFGGSVLTPVQPPPVENPAWSGWDVLAIAVLTFVAGAVLQLVVAKIAQSVWHPREDLFEIMSGNPILLLASEFLVYIPVAAFMVLLVKSKDSVPFWQSIKWNWPRSVSAMLVLGAGMFFALTLLEAFLPMPKDTPFEHLFDNALDAYLLSILAVTLGPLMEELFFRGFLYPVLARRMGVAWGIVLSALPFGLLHLQQYGWAWAAGLIIFLVGVVCGAVRAATKSVGASFLVHAGYNGTQMVILLVTTHGFRHMEKAMIARW